MRSTFKVLFYVKKGSEKPNGNLPLMCRITVDGEIKQFSCKMDVPPRLWEVKNSRASGKSVEAQKINLAVDKIRVEVNRRYQEQMQTDGYIFIPLPFLCDCIDRCMLCHSLSNYSLNHSAMGFLAIARTSLPHPSGLSTLESLTFSVVNLRPCSSE
jgi:hypothetical protein